MSESVKPVGIDSAGYDLLTLAMKTILNQFPGLREDEYISFEELGKEYGISFSADSGALVMSEKESITEHVTQKCQYPFFVVYRTKSSMETTKINVQSFLTKLGCWLCKETIEIDGTEYKLDEYPVLSGNRVIKKITRMNSYGTTPYDDGTQDWLLPVTVEYTNEYDL